MTDLGPDALASYPTDAVDPATATTPPTAGQFYRPDPAHPERLLRAEPGADPDPADLTAAAMHGAFRSFVLDPQYTCVGARSAVHNNSYRLGVYDPLGSPTATAALARDLAAFTRSIDDIDAAFATFVAIFARPQDQDGDEASFERALWAQLQALHDADPAAWDPAVSRDPDDPHFSFSFAGTAFFIVGLHPGSARLSRKFPWPALIFNPHAQFERLREAGKYARMQAVIRDKERALQGDINPVLEDFGADSEARQYSGRHVEPDWHPPFQAHEPGAPDPQSPHPDASESPHPDASESPHPTASESPHPAASESPHPAEAPGCPFAHPHPAARIGDRPRPGQRYRIPPHSGVAFLIDRGQTLRIIDPQGQQVCDLYSVAREHTREHLSSGRSIDYADTLYLSTGHTVYSNRERPMWTIGRDDVGRHDLVLTPCSPEMFRRMRGQDDHPSCHENLRTTMAAYGVDPDSIGSTFNIFMDVRFDPGTGKMTIAPPASNAGDRLELRAEQDMVVGLTACSSEVSNAGALKPIDFEIVAS